MRQPKQRIPAQGLDLKDQVISINRVTKVVKGGKNLSFAALVVVGDEGGQVLPQRDGFGRDDRAGQNSPRVQSAIFGLSQFSPLRARLSQRHGRILADAEFALAPVERVAEGPAPAAAFDLELQPLAIAVLAALEAGDGFGGERVLEHRP